jgi:UDP-MurNAc hydroxylase
MHITWVNHASFIAHSGSIAVLSDPWIEGAVFDNGWSLLSKTKFTFDDFAGVTHIFFSHEHPDHFNPPNIRQIPEASRRNIRVLFHETRDKRVVRYCNSLGFATQELPEDVWISLSENVEVLCGRNGRIDSWLAVRADGKTILNLNDCVFDYDSELLRISKLVGRPEVLFTQFSYANWVGNPDDYEEHRRHARAKLLQMKRQVEVLRPEMLVPCASFVWFSHQENYFANREANRIDDVYRFATEEIPVKTVVLYPGDVWNTSDGPADSSEALRHYREDYAAIERRPLIRSESVSLEKLQNAYHSFRRKLVARNKQAFLYAIPASIVLVSDLGIKLGISALNGIQVLGDGETPDITLSSEALLYCYLYDWGGDTLAINGRYVVPPGGNPARFFLNFRVPAYNATGLQFDIPLMLDIARRYVGRKFGISAIQKISR